MTLNIQKRSDGKFVLWYDAPEPSKLEMSEEDARNTMQLALLQDDNPGIRLVGMSGDAVINFVHKTPPQSTDELIEAYRELSGGRKFAIHAWSPQEDGV